VEVEEFCALLGPDWVRVWMDKGLTEAEALLIEELIAQQGESIRADLVQPETHIVVSYHDESYVLHERDSTGIYTLG